MGPFLMVQYFCYFLYAGKIPHNMVLTRHFVCSLLKWHQELHHWTKDLETLLQTLGHNLASADVLEALRNERCAVQKLR